MSSFQLRENEIQQTISLRAGWNNVSFFCECLLSDFIPNDSINIMKNDQHSFDKSALLFLNSLTNDTFSLRVPYNINCSQDIEITINGKEFESFTYLLNNGWNKIPYPFKTTRAASDFIDNENINKLKDDENSYDKDALSFLNSFSEFKPGSFISVNTSFNPSGEIQLINLDEPPNTEPPILNLIYEEQTLSRETVTIQPGAGFPDNHYLQTGHLVMNDKGEGVTRNDYNFYPTALPSDSSTWGAVGNDDPFAPFNFPNGHFHNIHPTLTGTDAASNPIPSVAGHNDDYNDKRPEAEVYNNWHVWNKYNSLAQQKMFTDLDLLAEAVEARGETFDENTPIVNPESNKIHFCVTSYLMETNDVFEDPTDTQNTDPANLKASRFAVGDAKAFARTAFKLDSARPYTVFSRELRDDNNFAISAIPLNDANVDHELTVIPVATNVDKYNIGMAGDSVSYKIQPGEGEGRLQIIQKTNLADTVGIVGSQGDEYSHSSSFGFAGDKKIYRLHNGQFTGVNARFTTYTLNFCHDRTNVDLNVTVVRSDGTETSLENSDSCVSGKFIQNIAIAQDEEVDVIITTADPNTTGDYTLTINGTADNIPATEVAFDETQLLTLDASQEWTESMINEVTEALNKWESVITATPTGTKISPTFSLQSFTDDTQLSQSIVNTTNMETFNGDHANFQITKGAVVLNKSRYDSDWNNGDNADTHSVTDHAIIELGHVLGIGTMWNKDVTVDESTLLKTGDSDLIDRNTDGNGFTLDGNTEVIDFYKGPNALAIYRFTSPDNQFANKLLIDGVNTNYSHSGSNADTPEKREVINNYRGIPIQTDPDINIIDSLKVREGQSAGGTALNVDGVAYFGLGHEYMTSLHEEPNQTYKLSAISLGFLKDLGYGVDFSAADVYDPGFQGGLNL